MIFVFAALKKAICDGDTNLFLAICEEINFPVSLKKTFWGMTTIVFLGFLIDTDNQVVSVPQDKVTKVLQQIDLVCGKKKITVKEMQKLCGSLNFLCHCIVLGRAFTHRLCSYTTIKKDVTVTIAFCYLITTYISTWRSKQISVCGEPF